MTKQLEYLTLEVGSIVTKANGFIKNADGILEHVAQGYAPTTIAQGNVGRGIFAAVEELEQSSSYGTDTCEVFANSSAAGGLLVTVHGLTYDLTAKAVKEACYGTGALIKKITAGDLSEYDIDEIEEINPKLIVLAGGVDYAAKETILNNALKLSAMDIGAPVVYAGNSALRRAVENIFHRTGIEIATVENIFQDVDKFNVKTLSMRLRDLFFKHVIYAQGIERLKALSNHSIIPTPKAVLRAAEIFAQVAGDALVIDAGATTTDIISVINGNKTFVDANENSVSHLKQTIEGDLGVFTNAQNIIEISEDASRKNKTEEIAAIPSTSSQKEMAKWLCGKAIDLSLNRHIAAPSDIFTPSAKKIAVKDKDLSAIKFIVGTGGALTRIEGAKETLSSVCTGAGKCSMLSDSAQILIDSDYLFSALGTISVEYPELVRNTLKCWREKNDKLFAI